LDLCLADSPGRTQRNGEEVAREMLISGKALAAMQNIIKTQGGDANVQSDSLIPGEEKFEYNSSQKGTISVIHNQQVAAICRILGCPMDKKSGIVLNRKLGQAVDKGDILCTLYTTDKWKLKEAIDTLKNIPIYKVK
jgi:pyrimidine-nucleoside phosphorylase